MTATKLTSLVILVVGGPCLAFFLVDFVRGASSYIVPFLWGAYFLAALPLATILGWGHFGPGGRDRSRFFPLFLGTLASLFLFLIFAGGAQVIAESIAAWNWERRGLPLGDHGSYREFYPGDSGMAHYPTPWHLILSYGLITGIAWVPMVIGLLALVRGVERLVGRVCPGRT